MNRRLLSIAPLTAALALLLTSSIALAQAEQDSGAHFFSVPAGSAAPNEFGWQLPPDDSGRWGGLQIPGDDQPKPFQLSRFFPNGIQLGHLASIWPGGDGPDFRVYQAGLVAIIDFNKNDLLPSVYGDAEVGGADAAEGVNLFKAQTLAQMDGVPELLAPRWAEIADTAELAGVEACADKQQVFFWASRLDEAAWQPADDETDKLVITWKNMVPRGSDCSDANAVLSFQLILTARAAPAPNGKPLARVDYRFGNCGWTVPMVPDPAAAAGPRTGLILDGANNEPRVAVELLGEHDRNAMVRPDIGLAVDDPRLAVPGVSGDPLRGSEYCQATNLAWALDQDGGQVAVEPGRYVIDLGANGLPLEDADGDGVTAVIDNCDAEYNPLQKNQDSDEFGDVCDGDVDGDSKTNLPRQNQPEPDNCIFVSNRSQDDLDGDGLGDACDTDLDGDGWHHPVPWNDLLEDNCPGAGNPLQWDFDSDGDGDACDWDGSFFKFLNDFDFSFSLKREFAEGFSKSEQAEMMWAMSQASTLDKDQRRAMLDQLFELWGKTKATLAEFVYWKLEMLKYTSTKHQ